MAGERTQDEPDHGRPVSGRDPWRPRSPARVVVAIAVVAIPLVIAIVVLAF